MTRRRDVLTLRTDRYLRFGLIWPITIVAFAAAVAALAAGWLALVFTPMFIGGAYVAFVGAQTRLTVTPGGIDIRSFQRRFLPVAEIASLMITPAPRPRVDEHQITAVLRDGRRVRLDLSTDRTPTVGFECLRNLWSQMIDILELPDSVRPQ